MATARRDDAGAGGKDGAIIGEAFGLSGESDEVRGGLLRDQVPAQAVERDDDDAAHGSGLDRVERQREDVVVAQGLRAGIKRACPQRMREDEGHGLLGEAVMGAQALAGKLGKIMLRGAPAEGDALVRDDREIALAILGQVEAGAGLLARQGERDAG